MESYLDHQGASFLERFDANSYLYLSRVLDYFDPFGDEAAAERLRSCATRFLVVSFDSDWRFPTAQARELVETLRRAGCEVEFDEIESPWGHDSFLLCIAAEGTRSKGEFWKPGFLRIAQQTGLPVSMGFVDGPTRTMGMGPTFTPTGDMRADMDVVRAFYADKRGFKPENRTEPRLREELES